MDREGKILRLGAAVILCAALIRIAGNPDGILQRERLLKGLFLWQTGYGIGEIRQVRRHLLKTASRQP